MWCVRIIGFCDFIISLKRMLELGDGEERHVSLNMEGLSLRRVFVYYTDLRNIAFGENSEINWEAVQ